MTELSRFWDTTTGGDAVDAPYDSSEFAEILMALGASEPIATHKSGVFRDVDNKLGATPGTNKVTIATGKALVSGRYYKNTAPIDITVPDATVGRRDRIVLKRDTAAQTVRLVRLAGVDNNSGTAPAIPAGDASTWYMPLWIINQAAGVGVAPTLITDERSYIPYHGDQGNESGTKHSSGQISGLPVLGGTPVAVTPGLPAVIGTGASYASGAHQHAITPPLLAYKTGLTVKTAVGADPQLQVTVLANTLYVVELVLQIYGDPAFGFQGNISIPSGSIVHWIALMPVPIASLEAPLGEQNSGLGGSFTAAFIASSVYESLYFRGLVSIGGAGGTLAFNWGPNSGAVGTQAGVKAGHLLAICAS
jgi:hypothetical protein